MMKNVDHVQLKVVINAFAFVINIFLSFDCDFVQLSCEQRINLIWGQSNSTADNSLQLMLYIP